MLSNWSLKRLKAFTLSKFFEMTIPTPPPLPFGLGIWWNMWVSGTKLVINEDWPSLSQVSVKQNTWIFLSIIISKISLNLLFTEHTLTSATLIKLELIGLGVNGEVGRRGLVGEACGWGHCAAEKWAGINDLLGESAGFLSRYTPFDHSRCSVWFFQLLWYISDMIYLRRCVS